MERTWAPPTWKTPVAFATFPQLLLRAKFTESPMQNQGQVSGKLNARAAETRIAAQGADQRAFERRIKRAGLIQRGFTAYRWNNAQTANRLLA